VAGPEFFYKRAIVAADIGPSYGTRTVIGKVPLPLAYHRSISGTANVCARPAVVAWATATRIAVAATSANAIVGLIPCSSLAPLLRGFYFPFRQFLIPFRGCREGTCLESAVDLLGQMDIARGIFL
jgi:hypothetical protein